MATSPKIQFKQIIRIYAILMAVIIVVALSGILYTNQIGEPLFKKTIQQILWVISLLFLLVIPGGLTFYRRKITPVKFGDALTTKLRIFRRGFYGQMVLLLLGVLVNTTVMAVTDKMIIALQLALLAGAATVSVPSLPRMQKDIKLGRHDLEQLQDQEQDSDKE